MIGRIAAALLLVAGASAPLAAELKYTMHMDVRKSEAPAPAATNPMIKMIGDMMTQKLVPAGGADMIYTLGEKGARVEFVQAAMGQPAGGVTITKPDGTLLILNPAEKTYWKTTMEAAAAQIKAAGLSPEATVKRTGEFETVSGVKCERITFDMTMALPIPEAARASMPPDFPSTLAMSGDGCITTDQYQKYAEIASKSRTMDFLATLGMDKLMKGGIMLRQKVVFVGNDMISTVTRIGEEDAPASLFEVPADYKEVPAPGMAK